MALYVRTAGAASRFHGSVCMALCLLLGYSLACAQSAPAPIQIRSAAAPSTSPSTWTWKAPQAAQLQFAVKGKVKGFPYQTTAHLDWRVTGTRYEAAQDVQIPVLGTRRQSSIGSITAQGLLPEVFMDRGRKEYSTTFDATQHQITFSRGTPSTAWVSGTQDRLSVFFQLSGMLAAAPTRYRAGTAITIQAASDRHVSPWTFRVVGRETLKLPAGNITAIKLQHIDGDGTTAEADQSLQSALWLAPSLDYLPVRIRLVENQQDELDLQLQSHRKP